MLRHLLSFLILVSISFSAFANTKRYRLSLRNDPSTSVVIGWEQSGGSGTMVYYGTTDFGQNWASYPNSHGIDRSVNASGMDNKFARLTGLTPDTDYFFVLKDSDGTSQRLWFHTTPMGNNAPISIIAGGDSRAFTDNSPRQSANLMVSKLRPDLVLFGGDYTWLATSLEWKGWMDDWQMTIPADGKMTPVIWERGNHELSSGIVIDLFDIPSTNDEYFAITVGGSFMRIYTLNTEISVAGNQKTWLENDLIANYQTHDWNIAQYHRTIRPHTTTKPNEDDQYNAWAQLFHDYRVQLIVESDAHDVKTTWPVSPSTSMNSDEGFILDTINGSVYIGEGCWGAPLRTNDWDKSWTRNSASFNSFHWLKVSRDTIEIRTIATDNAASVGTVTDTDKFTPPTGINIWNPSNGDVVYIVNQKYIDRPIVDISYPFHQQFFATPQNITITANASDANGTVQEVKFYVNDVFIGNDLTAPYAYNWSMPTDGDYTITAWAVDNDGWHNVSDDVRIFAGEIDITASLADNNDDAEETKSDGSVDLSSSDLELCIEKWIWPLSDEDQWIGLRFSGLEIPQSALISSAYIQFTADSDESDNATISIFGENVDNASPFTSATNNISTRAHTATQINWSPIGWTTNSATITEQTPDLKNIVTEITSRAGWQTGNSMVFLFEGSGTRSAYSRDTDVAKSAKLHVTYTHDSGLSIFEEKNDPFKIHPNPSTGIINIAIENDSEFTLEIFNLEGKRILKQQNLKGNQTINLKNYHVTSGLYIVKINTYTQKIIIK